MLEYLRKRFGAPGETREPLSIYDLRTTKRTHAYDDLLPPSVVAREFEGNGEFSATRKVVLVEESNPEVQLGYMILQQLYSDMRWMQYMATRNVQSLWIDRMDLTSLVPHRGIGTTLWNISHKIIQPGEHRAIIDTSHGWTKRKIQEATREGIFRVIDTDWAYNYGKPFKRYFVQYG